MPSHRSRSRQEHFVELALILVSLALCCLLYQVGSYRMVVLNLFYLPVVLAAFVLGRYRAGVLAVLCVVSAAVVTGLDLESFAALESPLVIGLALLVWAAVLGMTAILVGTMSDERSQKIEELHDAYLGVVEVLSRYLSSARPGRDDRAVRASELSQRVAARMKLTEKEMDDIRVAALLQDMENVEITARVIRRAMGDLRQAPRSRDCEFTFHGSELAQSLGTVLTGAMPLILDRNWGTEWNGEAGSPAASAIGARIIHTVKRYVELTSAWPAPADPRQAVALLKHDFDGEHHPAVLDALEEVVRSLPPLALPAATAGEAGPVPVAEGCGQGSS